MRRSWLISLATLALSGCFGARSTPTPTPAPTLPPVPTLAQETRGPAPNAVLVPLVTPTVAAVTIERVVVFNTAGQGANLRAEPARSAPSLTILLDGDEVDVIGADREQDGLTWRNVRDRLGNVGWVAAQFLGPPGSQSIAQPGPTAAAKPTVAAKPTAAAKPTGQQPTTAAKPTVAAKPTQEPAAKPQATAASVPLAVAANVARPVIAAGNQGLHVRVTTGGQPLAGARVVAVIQDGGATRTLDLGTTDNSGVATRSFDVGSPQGTVTINVTATTADGRTATAATSFSSS